MNNDLITVIVPIYNIEKYLPKCIDSILNQTYNNIEVILIDDGSTDNSGKICDKYKKIDNRIIVIHKKNGGLSSARNKGLDIANGELISFVDGDDYLENNYLEELKINMDKYNSDISICNYNYIKDSKTSVINFNESDIYFDSDDKYYSVHKKYRCISLVAWNKLYRKKVFNNVRYPDGKLFEDIFVICDLIEKARRISYTFKPLYNYVYRDNSIMNDFSINHFDKIDSFNKNIDVFCCKGFYDLALEEKKRKMDVLVTNLSKMKRHKINNKEIYNKHYQELVDTNKEVKWKDSTKYVKFYKIFRKSSISMLAFTLKVKDFIKK